MMAFDAEAATARYIDSLGSEALQKAADYTAGSHWHLLWGLLVSALVTWLLVRWGGLDRLQARLESREFFLRTFLVAAVYSLLSAIISLPWGVYEGWWRERSYGRTSQPLGDYLMQGGITILISTLIAGLFLVGLFCG